MRRKLDVVVIVDRSTSMKKWISDLNSCIRDIAVTLKDTPEYVANCDIFFSVLQFPVFEADGEDAFVCKALNINADTAINFPEITSRGATNPSFALTKAAEFVIQRYENWGKDKLPRFHPFIFFLTDGRPDAGADVPGGRVDEQEQKLVEENYEKLANYIKSLHKDRKLQFYAFAIGNADIGMLRKLTSDVYDYTSFDMKNAFKAFSEFLLTETRATSDTTRKMLESDRSIDEGGADGEHYKVSRSGNIS